MIVTKETGCKIFKPTKLTITFETQEEYDSFKSMAQLCDTVSEQTERACMRIHLPCLNRHTLKSMLSNIYHKLEN